MISRVLMASAPTTNLSHDSLAEAQIQCLILVATYNEIENLPGLIAKIHQLHPQIDVLVVDDNSPDGTGQWVSDFRRQEPWCHLISRAGKLGLGSATLSGFQWALERDYTHVLTMDADFSHDPSEIGRLLEASHVETAAPGPDGHKRGQNRVVIGSRYVAGGKIEGWPWRRRWASRWINRFARRWLGLPTRDNSGAFRCYPTALLKTLALEKITNQGYGYLEEILYMAHRQGASFREVPITFRDRTQGTSKINLREALHALGTLFLLRFRG